MCPRASRQALLAVVGRPHQLRRLVPSSGNLVPLQGKATWYCHQVGAVAVDALLWFLPHRIRQKQMQKEAEPPLVVARNLWTLLCDAGCVGNSKIHSSVRRQRLPPTTMAIRPLEHGIFLTKPLPQTVEQRR